MLQLFQAAPEPPRIPSDFSFSSVLESLWVLLPALLVVIIVLLLIMLLKRKK